MSKELCPRCNKAKLPSGLKRAKGDVCDRCAAAMIGSDPKYREAIRKARNEINAGNGIRYVLKNGKLQRAQ